ncbi:MAG: prepilin-type N-terminal cleavage/methylation domain-containing protein [Desulfuromonadales bacterium]
MNNHRMRQNGYSLVEVMIGMTIFAIALLGLAKVQLATMLGNQTARDITEATMVAQNKVEALKMEDRAGAAWTDTDDDGIPGLSDEDSDADASQTDLFLHGKQYDIFWNIAADTPADGNRLLRVIVRWTNRGEVKRVSLDYVGSEMGL